MLIHWVHATATLCGKTWRDFTPPQLRSYWFSSSDPIGSAKWFDHQIKVNCPSCRFGLDKLITRHRSRMTRTA